MSILQGPREPLRKTGESVEDGLVRVDELREYALPALWGSEFSRTSLKLLPIGIGETQALRDAFDHGRDVVLARHFQEALSTGMLVAKVCETGRSNEKNRISSSAWGGVYLDGLLNLLRTGSGFALRLDIPALRKSDTVLLDEDEAEIWLGSLSCRSERPDPAELDKEHLPDDVVTISQGVCWLAGQPIGDSYDYANMEAPLREAAKKLSGLKDDEKFGSEYATLCESFANQLAQKEVRNQTALAIRKACANGHLDAYGEPEGNHGGLVKIDKAEFLTKKEFTYFEDMLNPGASDSQEETRLAQSSGSWKHVRFHPDEFLKLWSGDSLSAERQNSPQKNPKKRELAARAYRKLFPNGHRVLGLQWIQVENQVKGEINASVSLYTIKRGLDELGSDGDD